MTSNIYMVVDCNNFFVSCERLFRPDLEGEPVIVLSNNDGCAVSRSNEAKPHIPMGAPFFKYENVICEHNIRYFSANFQLYGDMSQRVMGVLDQFAPDVEQYSVDEAFVQLTKLGVRDCFSWGSEVRERILKWTGIPVSIGIGPTKTLAKAAVELAKRRDGRVMVVGATDVKLADLPVGDVWGVGRGLTPKLKARGIKTAHDLANVDPDWMAQFSSITGARMVRELNGMDCFGSKVTYNEPPQKTISATRSFGRRVSKLYELESAVASFVARATHRLRHQGMLASEVSIFATTGKHASQPHTATNRAPLDIPTSDTGAITEAAIGLLGKVFDPGCSYKRAGVMLSGLVSRQSQQLSVLQPNTEESLQRREQLMQAVDEVNRDWGKGTLKLAAEGVSSKPWRSKRQYTSGRYTTSWDEIPVVT